MKEKETVIPRVSLGEQIARLLPEGSDALREHVRRVWSHTYGDTRGVDTWMTIVEFREPVLRFEVESRGADRLVRPVIDAPPRDLTTRWSGADCGLCWARDTLYRIVERAWGDAPHRYHWVYTRGRQRFERERAALERTFRAAVDDVWIPFAMSALQRAMNTPIWRSRNGGPPRYRVGFLADSTLVSGQWDPVSPAAYQQVDAWRGRVAHALASLRPRILRLTADDIRGYSRVAYPPLTHPIIATNRPSSLLYVLAWVEHGRPEHVPSVQGIIPGLWDAVERDEVIVSHCHALRAALATEEVAVRCAG